MRRADTQTDHSAPSAVDTARGGAVYVAPEGVPEGAGIYFFTRLGGVSEPPYDSLNISRKVGDSPEAVDENLALIREALDLRPAAWVRQVAGDNVVRVSEPGLAGEADALVTAEPDLCLSVAVADCVPVALVSELEVGMVHSGWRGTLAGVSGKATQRLAGVPCSGLYRAFHPPLLLRGVGGARREVRNGIRGRSGLWPQTFFTRRHKAWISKNTRSRSTTWGSVAVAGRISSTPIASRDRSRDETSLRL